MSGGLAQALRALACLLFAAAVYAWAPSPDKLGIGLAMFALIGSLWMTQSLNLTVTALLVPALAILSGLMTVTEAFAPFANPVIFLFLGGFALAAALQRHGLDRALAMGVMRLAGGRRGRAVLLLFGLTAVLSMWISNTATAAMMLPLAIGLLGGGSTEKRADASATAPVQGDVDQADDTSLTGHREQAFVLLGLAYSASIGGIGTLVGSPPNAIAAAQAGISFAEWMKIGLPLVLVLLPLMIGVLYLVLRPRLAGRMCLVHEPLVWTRERRISVVIFALTAACWIGSAPLGRLIGLTGDTDSLVAVLAIVALVASGTLRWGDIEEHTQWGVLLLFGGGLALSQVMSVSGASAFLADRLVDFLQGAPLVWLLLGVVAFVVFLTELVSNTASAALLVPIFLGVAAALGMPPALLAAAIAVSASCAFMLPVATPPNALVFGTGLVSQSTMMRCGLVLNAVCIVAITALAMGLWT